jgi:hypothetical protein
VCEKRINHKRALFVIGGDTSDTYFNAYLFGIIALYVRRFTLNTNTLSIIS